MEELHKWGWRMESSNSIHHGGLNTTRAKQPAKEVAAVAAVEPVAKDDGKRAGQTQKADSMLGEFSSSKDTPRDMAEYIFWTGDEQGVTGAVMEFITQGLVCNGPAFYCYNKQFRLCTVDRYLRSDATYNPHGVHCLHGCRGSTCSNG